MPVETNSEAASLSGTRSSVRWVLVSLLFLLSAVAFLDRVNISIAGSLLADEYHLTYTQLGRVFSALLFGYMAFQIPGGWLADRLGSRSVLAAGALWWGAFTALTAVIPHAFAYALGALMALRFLLGAGEAVMYPASNQFVSCWIPTQERGLANGLIFAGVGIGSGLTPPLITYIMLHHGWRSSFWICALIGLTVGAVWYLASRDTPEEHSRVSPAELAMIQTGRTRSGSAADPVRRSKAREPENATVPWAVLLGSRTLWAITLAYFFFGYVAWIFFSWFYIYLAKVRGLNFKASAFYSMLPFLAMATACFLGGFVSDRLTMRAGKRAGRCGVAVCAMILAAIFLALGSSAQNARLASMVLAGGAGALYLAQSSFWSISADIAGRFSGSVSGFMNMGAQLGGAVTASLTPAIASHFGWRASFLVAAVLSALGACAWLLVNPERRLA